jgi:magnesium transporter
MDLDHYRRWFALPTRRESPPEPGAPHPAPAVAPVPAVPTAPPVIRVFSYGPDEFEEVVLSTPEELSAWKDRRPVTWVDVDGVGDPDTVRRIAGLFGMHVLAQDDVLNPTQRPKVEQYDEHLFIVSRMLFVEDDRLASEQLSVFLGAGFLLTFQQQRPGDCLAGVRERLRKAVGRMRRSGPDYLAWALVDAVVDGYFPVLEAFGERLDALEDVIVERPTPECIADIHQVKRDLLALRRAVWPLRDALASLLREETPLIGAETRPFFRDCLDHAVQVLDMIETYREIGSSLMEAYQSSVGNRLNAVMKVLTIIATVFMPLSFLASVYGMNFHTEDSPFNMPELSWHYGYVFFWSLILASAGGMLFWFRRKGWLGGRDRWD